MSPLTRDVVGQEIYTKFQPDNVHKFQPQKIDKPDQLRNT